MPRTLLSGWPYPLIAKAGYKDTNSLHSDQAIGVCVCLFDAAGTQINWIALKERTAFLWHGLVRRIGPWQLYGNSVKGLWDPEKGNRFDSAKHLQTRMQGRFLALLMSKHLYFLTK